jgi:hypothetical protein
MVFGFLIIPLAGTFKTSLGWPRTAMWSYTAVMAALGVGSLLTALGAMREEAEPNWVLFGGFLLGVIAAPWVANVMAMQRPKR